MARETRSSGKSGRVVGSGRESIYARLFVAIGLVGVAVLLTAVFTRVAIRNLTGDTREALTQLAERIDKLDASIAGLESRQADFEYDVRELLADLEAARPRPRDAGESRSGSPVVRDETVSDEGVDQGGGGAAGVTEPVEPASGGGAAPWSERYVEAQLRQLLTKDRNGLPTVAADDVGATGALLEGAGARLAESDWSAETWARLGILGRLLGRGPLAESFARKARSLGDPAVVYDEVSLRVMLLRGEAQAALPYAERLRGARPESPTVRVLSAAAYLGAKQPAKAAALIEGFSSYTSLSLRDRLLLGRVYVSLGWWVRLDEVLATVAKPPVDLEAERSFLYALSLLQGEGREAEALAVLKYLADVVPLDREPVPTTQRSVAMVGGLPDPHPDLYEIRTWQGVALMNARQFEAAREILDTAVKTDSSRPAAWYWRGMVELRALRFDAARVFLENALATAADYAPAWEALAMVALQGEGREDLSAALAHIERALEHNPRRASAQFLCALIHAKASRREAAAAALEAAFSLRPAYLDEALQAPVFQRLFSASQLRALAGQDEDGSAAPREAEGASGAEDSGEGG